mgnify:CR=1 FL=1
MAVKKRFPYKAAFVACNGGCRATAECQYGCVGCELCVNVCKFEAIALNEYGVAEVDEDKCIACGKCVKTGYCVFKDDCVNEAIDLLRASDGIIVGSPVYYAGPSGRLCSFLDRIFYCKSAPYAGKPAATVVSCRRGGATEAFARLNMYFQMTNMPLVSSQYWNQVHGNTPEEVKQDIEGLQTMRTLGRNMAWLIKCIAAGKAAGIGLPQYEAWTPTNFIH